MKSPTPHQLKLAGWFSLVSAIITVPLFLLSLLSLLPAMAQTDQRTLELTNTLLFILHVGFYTYAYFTLRDLLQHYHSFHLADTPISIIVGINVFSAILQALAFIFSDTRELSSTLALLSLIPYGIASIVLGLRLLKLKAPLSGLRSALSYLFIFTGVAVTSIVLLLPGILLGIALDIVLGIVLIRASEEIH